MLIVFQSDSKDLYKQETIGTPQIPGNYNPGKIFTFSLILSLTWEDFFKSYILMYYKNIWHVDLFQW